MGGGVWMSRRGWKENIQHRMGGVVVCVVTMSGDEGVSRKECGRRGVGGAGDYMVSWLLRQSRTTK